MVHPSPALALGSGSKEAQLARLQSWRKVMKQGLPGRGQGSSDPETWCDECAKAGKSDGSFLTTGEGEGDTCENPSHGLTQPFDDGDELE